MPMDDLIIKYPRTPHIEGSRLQPGDEDLSQVPFSQIAGRHIVIEEKIDGANSADAIFSGDTLFCTGIGRTDFPTSSMQDMMQSIRRLRDLEGDYRVYPGHDMFSTLNQERKYNPYMN